MFFFWSLQECIVKTSKGSVSVLVCGDRDKPALITYPDVALNCIILVLVAHFALILMCMNECQHQIVTFRSLVLCLCVWNHYGYGF